MPPHIVVRRRREILFERGMKERQINFMELDNLWLLRGLLLLLAVTVWCIKITRLKLGANPILIGRSSRFSGC